MADKVALVTGAGSGIGRAAALRLAEDGFAVGVLGHTPEENHETAEAIRENGGTALELGADVTSDDGLQAAFDKLAAEHGRVDVVVANAGINGVWAPIEELPPSEFDKTIAVNLKGTFLTIRAAVPHLKRAGGGSIVVISSINGTRTFTSPGATAYSATKAAQLAMVQQLAPELGQHRIRINAICPGAIDTEIDDNTDIRHPEKSGVRAEWPEGSVPLTDGKPGTSAQVANVIAFLASNQSDHITGSPIWVDGGQSLLR